MPWFKFFWFFSHPMFLRALHFLMLFLINFCVILGFLSLFFFFFFWGFLFFLPIKTWITLGCFVLDPWLKPFSFMGCTPLSSLLWSNLTIFGSSISSSLHMASWPLINSFAFFAIFLFCCCQPSILWVIVSFTSCKFVYDLLIKSLCRKVCWLSYLLF